MLSFLSVLKSETHHIRLILKILCVLFAISMSDFLPDSICSVQLEVASVQYVHILSTDSHFWDASEMHMMDLSIIKNGDTQLRLHDEVIPPGNVFTVGFIYFSIFYPVSLLNPVQRWKNNYLQIGVLNFTSSHRIMPRKITQDSIC